MHDYETGFCAAFDDIFKVWWSELAASMNISRKNIIIKGEKAK